MKVQISSKTTLSGIPSASGVELINGLIYIIGDDSKVLFVLDDNLQIMEHIVLFESDKGGHERIAKKIKPDLEAITHLKIDGSDYLLINGSGSKDNRDDGYLIGLSGADGWQVAAQKLDFKPLYNLLRADNEIVKDGKLNIEASASDAQFFILLNRANKKGNNAVLVFETWQMLAFLADQAHELPAPKVCVYHLPDIGGVPSGFSGACILEDKLFFTASAEDTEDAIEDGDVTGSLIGYMQLGTDKTQSKRISEIKAMATITHDGVVFLGKVESITIYKKHSENHYSALAVTDNDVGESELIRLEIIL